jgi:hypothetical protein
VGPKGDGKRDRQPKRASKRKRSPIDPGGAPVGTDSHTPKFCLKHLQYGYDVKALPEAQQADFAVALQNRANLTWTELTLAPHHGLGSEPIPAAKIRPSVPTVFSDAEDFLVFRYSGLKPMVGVRARDVFHVVWIERQFGEVYDHGGS